MPAIGGTQQESCPQLPDASPPAQMGPQEPASGGGLAASTTRNGRQRRSMSGSRRWQQSGEWLRESGSTLWRGLREGPVRQSRAARIHGSGCQATANALHWMRCRGVVRVLQDVQGRHRGEVVQRAASLVRRPTMKRWPVAARRDKRHDRCN